MANWFDNYWAALKPIIASAWPELPHGNLFMDNAIERRDWINMLNAAELATPYCIVSLEFTPTTDWGIGAKYELAATIYYLTATAAAPGGTTASSLITGKLVELQQALFASDGSTGLGTVLDQMTFSMSAENPANISLLDAKLPYQAGSLTTTMIVSAS